MINRFILIIGTTMAVSFNGHTKSYDRHCFRIHIQESISINSERKKVYAALTKGQSNRIFTQLIAGEVATLAPATYFDLKALSYQKKGMPLFCHEFMSMNRTPDFDPDQRKLPTETIRPVDWRFYATRLKSALGAHDADGVRRITIEALLDLKQYPHYYCMTRHMFESIYRFAYFVPLRREEAKDLGLHSPEKLMFDVMRLHLLGIKGSYEIDLLSQPIQEAGIPILCSEIPDLLFDLDADELKPLKDG